MGKASAELLLGLTDKVSGPARGIDATLDRLSKRQGMLADGMARGTGATAKAASALGMVARTAAVAAPLAAAEGMRQAVVAAADFESALTGIQKKAGTTAAQTAKIGEEIKALATSGDLAVPIEEIFGAYERGAAAGIPLAELKEFATLSAKAADAFEMSATDVGNAAAGFKTAFKIDSNEVGKLFDLINALADSGISDEKDIVDFLDRSGASLKLFGQSQEQAAALGATLLNLKMPAEVAARAMNTLTSKMLAPGSKKSQKAFAALVKDTGKFNKLLKDDPNQALLDLLDKINGMNKFDATEELNGWLGQGFSDEVLRLAKGVDELRRNQKLAADESQWFGSLDKSYKLKLDDMWQQWQVVKNQMSELMIDVGTTGLPAVKAGLEGIRALVDGINTGLELDLGAAYNAGLAKEVARGGSMSDALGEYTRRYKESRPDYRWLTDSKEMYDSFQRDVADYGRGVIDSPFFRVDQAKNRDNPGRFPGKADAQAASDALRARQAGNLDGGPVRHGYTPVPSSREVGAAPPMSEQEQRGEYSRGRMLGEQAARGYMANMSGRDALAGIVGRIDATTPRPSAALTAIGVPQAAAKESRVTVAPRPDIVGPVTLEGEAAAAKAVEIGGRISDAFSVTATATVKMDDQAVDASEAKVDRLLAKLARVGAAARSAQQDVEDAASVSMRRTVDFDGLHVDLTP